MTVPLTDFNEIKKNKTKQNNNNNKRKKTDFKQKKTKTKTITTTKQTNFCGKYAFYNDRHQSITHGYSLGIHSAPQVRRQTQCMVRPCSTSIMRQIMCG